MRKKPNPLWASSASRPLSTGSSPNRPYSIFRSGCIVASGLEVVGAFDGCEGIEQRSDGGPEAFDRPLGGFAQECFELGEGILNRVEIRAVGREVEQACPRRLDQGPHPRSLVAGQVVQDHDVARPQG